MIDLRVLRYRQLLVEELVSSFNMDEHEAKFAVQQSTINEMLDNKPSFIMHYLVQNSA